MSESAAELDHRHLWHPFTQQRDWCAEEPLVIGRGEGTDLIDSDGRRYIDGVSSLWCNVHGHGHPLIDAAVREQLDRVAHSTMLGRTSFVCLRDAYHGDTIGAVSVGGIDLFHSAYGPLLFRAHRVTAGDVDELANVLDLHEEEIAAVIVEPLVQGAAGMRVHPPGYLRAVRELTERHDTFLICDEVATGFGRTGTMFACEQERVSPDFLCLGKGLTGGYLPLAATLTAERVYEGFLGSAEEGRTFFHGHTFTGNPLACAAALASLDAFEREDTLVRLQPKIRLLGELLQGVAGMPEVVEVRGRGFMVGIDLGDHPADLRLGHRVVLEARRRGAILRPLGDVIVLMPPLAISKADLARLVEIVAESIRAAHEGAYRQAAEPAVAELRAAA
jgi:adenosylmethionine-8-amino-7-oxononanoate aminotransferase